LRRVEHEIVAELPLNCNVGFGYRVVCSCHQLIEVWPEHYLTKAVAESLAREQWVAHSQELSATPRP
jgi:hypothetical protein